MAPWNPSDDASRTPTNSGSDFYLQLAGLSAASWRQRRVARLVRLGTMLVADVLAGIFTSALLLGSFNPDLPVDVAGEVRISYRLTTITIIPVWLISLALVGEYQRRPFNSLSDEWISLAKGAIVLFFGRAAFEFIRKTQLSRGYTGRLIVTYLVIGVVVRSVFRPLTRIRPRLLLLGDRNRLDVMSRSLSADDSVDVVSAFLIDSRSFDSEQVVSLLSTVAESRVNTVVIVGRINNHQALLNALVALGVLHCEILSVPESAPSPIATGSAVVIGTNLLLRIGPSSSNRFMLVKWLLDRVGAAVLIVVLSPLAGVVALRLRLSSGSPVFFRQTRVGRGGGSSRS